MNTSETIAYYKGLTKRQLFKAYRDAVTHLNECNVHYNTGHDYLHGERIVPYQRAAQTEVSIIESVIDDYFDIPLDAVPNVPELIVRFTIDQRREFIRERDVQREKTSLENVAAEKARKEEPVIAGMLKLADFNYNYSAGFIELCFGENNIAKNLKSKFIGCYDKFGARGVMPAFLAELDAENKKQLFSYILNK